MPQPPDPAGPKHLGLIVDPLVTETEEPMAASPTRTGHPVRDRLLEKAQAAKETRAAAISEANTLPTIGVFSAPFTAPRGRAPSAPDLRRKRRDLSPLTRAGFVGLMALALGATVVALLTNSDDAKNLGLLNQVRDDVEATELKGKSEAASPSAPKALLPPETAAPATPKAWRIEHEQSAPGLKILRGDFKDQPFLRALQDAGLDTKQAYRAFTALKETRDLNRTSPSHQFLALVSVPSGVLKAIEYIENKENVYQAKENELGLLVGAKLDLQVRRSQKQAALLLTSQDFDQAARQAGLDPSVRGVLADALRGHATLDSLELPCSIRLLVQEVTVEGAFARYAGVEALEVRFLSGDPLRVYYFKGVNAKGYFDAKGRSVHQGGWRKPIPDAPITSHFNPKRLHPVLKKVMPHNGTDFGAPTGEPVYAASFGVVKSVGFSGPSGNLVVIDHPGGIETGYAHLSRFAEGLKPGDKVKRLQLVGYVGSTGRSTGPHLHFSVKRNGAFVDPLSLDLDKLVTLPASERAGFQEARDGYDRILESIPLPQLPQEPVGLKRVMEADMHDDLEGGEAALGSGATPEPVGAGASPPPPLGPPPASPAANSNPAAAPPSAPAGTQAAGPRLNAVYLTDTELLKLQQGNTEGQVAP